MNRKPTLADYKRAMRQYARELRKYPGSGLCPFAYLRPAGGRRLHEDMGGGMSACTAARGLRRRGFSNTQIADAFERAAK